MTALLVVHAAATLYMTGLIWFVQLVHYPLMAHVGQAGYTDYQRLHERNTGWAVGPVMLVELVTASVIVVLKPQSVSLPLVYLGIGLLALIWLSTWLLQIPCHKRLGQGFDSHAHQKLVRTNWLRTILWSARGVIALLLLI